MLDHITQQVYSSTAVYIIAVAVDVDALVTVKPLTPASEQAATLHKL